MPKTKTCVKSLITATKWLPVFVTISIFSWAWYAYMIQLVLFSMQSLVQQILCSVIFHVIYILSFWSYIQTIFTPFGTIPNKFYLAPEISEDLAKAPSEQHRDEILAFVVKRNDLPVNCRTYSGGIRFCEKCNLIKPDRCHHCSICGVCVLKMDHHCPWINNCVSFTNYKFFVLFLGYTFILCLFVAASAFPYFLKFWSMADQHSKYNNSNGTNINLQDNDTPISNQYNSIIPFGTKFHILFLFFVSTMLSIGIMFLYCYHVHLLINNRSTLEAFRPPLMTYGPDRNAFNLGKRENIYQLFGRAKLLWLVPIFTTEGSGLFYNQRPQMGPGDEEVRQELLNQNINNNNNIGNTNLTNNSTRPNNDTKV